MRRVTSARSVLESSPASHARLTPRYASRSAAAYPGLIVSGILLTPLPETSNRLPRHGPSLRTIMQPRFRMQQQCLPPGTRPGELSDLSSYCQLGDEHVA